MNVEVGYMEIVYRRYFIVFSQAYFGPLVILTYVKLEMNTLYIAFYYIYNIKIVHSCFAE